MSKIFFPLIFLIILISHQNGVPVEAQMEISVTTFGPPVAPGAPNTFIATGSQIASSLLESDTPILLWGVVSSKDVREVCKQIVNTGNMNFSATVHVAPSSGDDAHSSTVHARVSAMGGCLAASDGSGTEAIIVANNGRQSAVVCPNDAGSKGCGVYFMGDDVVGILSQKYNRRLLASTTTSTSRKLLDCKEGAGKGAITGVLGSVLMTRYCLPLGVLAPFCAAGVIGVGAEIGAAGGCAAGAAGGCFPGDASVLLADGRVKPMTELALGEKVAVGKQDGSVTYEDVYAFGHKDASASGYYIQLSMESIASGGNVSRFETESRTLELTLLHFAQVSAGPEGKILYKRAQEIRVGDKMWAQSSNADIVTSPYVVTSVSAVTKQGLYNPFTLSGTIIVNGVAASTHSDWFLDSTFDFLGLTNRLPSAYQTILSPVRTLYYIFGKEAYISLYDYVDTLINIANFGARYGGQFMTLTIASASSIFVAVVFQSYSQIQGLHDVMCSVA